jgi:hypothetical protein
LPPDGPLPGRIVSGRRQAQNTSRIALKSSVQERKMSMKNSKFIPLLLITLMIAAPACSPDENGEMTEIPGLIDVVIHIEPEQLSPGEPVSIQAVVTQEGKPVEDANEVTFEIWKEGQNEAEHEKIAGEHWGEGVYGIEKTFSEPGTYYVISHVTARGAHNMPKKQFTVGSAGAEDTSRQPEEKQQTAEEEQPADEHHHH